MSLEHNKQLLLDSPGTVFGMLTRGIAAQLKPAYHLGPLGWLDTSLSSKTERGFLNIFLIAVLLDVLAVGKRSWHRQKRPPRPARARPVILARLLAGTIFIGGLLVSAYGTALAMFVYGTPKGATEMGGLQARYLTPMILVCLAGLFIIVRSPAALAADPATPAAPRTVSAPLTRARAVFEEVVLAVPLVWVLVAGCFYGASLFLDLARRFF